MLTTKFVFAFRHTRRNCAKIEMTYGKLHWLYCCCADKQGCEKAETEKGQMLLDQIYLSAHLEVFSSTVLLTAALRASSVPLPWPLQRSGNSSKARFRISSLDFPSAWSLWMNMRCFLSALLGLTFTASVDLSALVGPRRSCTYKHRT